MSGESKCRSCGRAIVWKTTQHGKKVPLDPRAVVFSVVGEIAVKPSPGVTGEVFMVSHFATCPDANEWSKKGSEPPPPDRDYSEPATAE